MAAALLALLATAGSASAQTASSPPSTAPRPTRTAAEIYDAACAACHGPDGKGTPLAVRGFELEPPDFSDCNFATREPDADWGAIVHGGGPVRGFDRTMPSFGDALTEDEIALAVSHVRTFCGDPSWPRGDLNLPRAIFTEKAYPEDEAVWTTGLNVTGDGEFSNEIVYEKRFGARNQIEIKAPFAVAHQPGSTWMGGAGDIGLGFKRAFYHDMSKGRIAAFGGEVVLPTGDESSGIGSGALRFEPFASFGQILRYDAFFQAQGGAEISANENNAGHEAFWRLVVGRTWVQGRYGRAWTPMVELLAARELESGAKIEWDLVPQVQVTLNQRQHLMLNVGLRMPVSVREGRSTSLMVYFLWDWFDGGLRDGW
ncbi:MAG: cytochrome c [Vicinamibacterales bacterium]